MVQISDLSPVTPDLGQQFAESRYAVLGSLISAELAQVLYRYVITLTLTGRLRKGDPQVAGCPAGYGDPMMDSLMEELRPRLEQILGIPLYSTYAYFRLYTRGADLKRHRDRPACEISLTLTLGHEGGSDWPIWFEGPQGTTSISLSPGEAAVYRGHEIYHWREPYEGQQQAQVFLHYVDRQGPHGEWKFDKRPLLGLPHAQFGFSPDLPTNAAS